MIVSVSETPIEKQRGDTIVLSFFEDERPLKGASGILDWELRGVFSRLLAERKLRGSFGETAMFFSTKRQYCYLYLLFGLGSTRDYTYHRLMGIAGIIAETLVKLGRREFIMTLPGSHLCELAYPRATEVLVRGLHEGLDKAVETGDDLRLTIVDDSEQTDEIVLGLHQAKVALKRVLPISILQNEEPTLPLHRT